MKEELRMDKTQMEIQDHLVLLPPQLIQLLKQIMKKIKKLEVLANKLDLQLPITHNQLNLLQILKEVPLVLQDQKIQHLHQTKHLHLPLVLEILITPMLESHPIPHQQLQQQTPQVIHHLLKLELEILHQDLQDNLQQLNLHQMLLNQMDNQLVLLVHHNLQIPVNQLEMQMPLKVQIPLKM